MSLRASMRLKRQKTLLGFGKGGVASEWALFSGPGQPGNSEGGCALAAGVTHRYRLAEPGPISVKAGVKLDSFYS